MAIFIPIQIWSHHIIFTIKFNASEVFLDVVWGRERGYYTISPIFTPSGIILEINGSVSLVGWYTVSSSCALNL